MEMIMSIHAVPGPAAAMPPAGQSGGAVARWRRLLWLAVADAPRGAAAALAGAATAMPAASPLAQRPAAVIGRRRRLTVVVWAREHLVGVPRRLVRLAAERHRRRCAAAELGGLSEHVLADIGLSPLPLARGRG